LRTIIGLGTEISQINKEIHETLVVPRDHYWGTHVSIAKQKSVVKWLLNLKQSSSQPYLYYLNRFCEYAKLDPDTVLENAKSSDKAREATHDTLKAFRRDLESKGNSSNTLQQAYMSVRSFLAWNGVKLDRMPRAFKGRVRYESDRVLEPHEVARMISFAKSTRDKAVISTLCHAQRVGVLPALRYGMIREQLEKNVNPIVIDVKGDLIDELGVNVNKESVPYRFAIVRETADLIRQMLRERRGAEEPIDDESWLFRSYSRSVKAGKGLRRIPASQPGPALRSDFISEMVQEVAVTAGIQKKRLIGKMINGTQKVKYDVHAHVFRRFWKRQMRQAGIVDKDFLDFMMGHKLPYDGAYDKFDADYIRKEYAKAEPFLTVMVSPDVTEQIELKTLEEKHAPVLQALPEDTRVKYETKSPREKVQFLKSIPAQMKTSKSKYKKGERMIIDASQIDNHCNHGWRAVFQFQDGRVQVEYDVEEESVEVCVRD
jgi:integrase